MPFLFTLETISNAAARVRQRRLLQPQFEAAAKPYREGRNIPSLDGLRAVSVLLVVLNHFLERGFAIAPYWLGVVGNGQLGVNTFLVISGFLITRLLVKELDASATISLRRFYFRRSLRIFPAFYVFMAVAAIIIFLGRDPAGWRGWLSAATYTWNYNLHTSGWVLGHTWSLSLEEQFYLFWPAVVLISGKRRAATIAAVAIATEPMVRVATYVLVPALRGNLGMMVHTRLDTLMFGGIVALTYETSAFKRIAGKLASPWVAAAASAFALFASPALQLRYKGAYVLPFGMTLDACCITIVLLYAVRFSTGRFGRILNLRWVRHLGVLSYSIYLWQQLFTGPAPLVRGVWALPALLAVAELSYWLVERPMLRFRDGILSRRPAASEGQARVLSAPA